MKRTSLRHALPVAALTFATSCVPALEPKLGWDIPADYSIAVPDHRISIEGMDAAPNAHIILAAALSPPAPSRRFSAHTPSDSLRALNCLTEAIYYEAWGESEEGQRAVAQVVLNRVRHPFYPDSICEVVYQGPLRNGGGCQFSFACDGSLARWPSQFAWNRARAIAAAALSGIVYAPVGHATHYHSFAVSPFWAPAMDRVAIIGRHIFYRRPGNSGEPKAFTNRYAGKEPAAYALARTAPIKLPSPIAKPLEVFVQTSFTKTAAPTEEPILALPLSPILKKLPESRVRPEFANSGTWIRDPAAIGQ